MTVEAAINPDPALYRPNVTKKLAEDSEQNVYAIIPARAGSKRVPDKNIELLPYTIAFATNAYDNGLINTIIITTDYPSSTFGKYIVGMDSWWIDRNPDLCKDDSPMEGVISDALHHVETKTGIGILLQPTSPFRSMDDLDKIVTALRYTSPDWIGSICTVQKSLEPWCRVENGNLYGWRIGKDLREEPCHYLEQDSLLSFQVDTPIEMEMFRKLR
jgi:N-acylneuraminate cytidylyltransferase